MGKKMLEAQDLKIQVIPEDYFDDVKDGGAVAYITSKSLCDWGADPRTRIPTNDEVNKSKSKSIYTKSVPKSVTLTLKAGGAVDPDSGLQDKAHVYQSGSDKYNAVLGITDIQSDKNSYYKLQILQADKRNNFWVFRSWGRIGTTIGGNKLEDYNSDSSAAIEQFKALYYDKTGNHWSKRKVFKKIPHKMYPIDVDYEHEEKKMGVSDIKSSLAKPIQKLVKMLFDVDTMKKVMLEFELDMEKMPLGKLSRQQMQSAYSVLTELTNLIQSGGSQSRFIDASNRFYTLVPHDFGVDIPPVMDTMEVLKIKVDMLDSLMELEIAYNMLSSEADGTKSPLDVHYEQLKTEMEPMKKDTEEYKLLVEYVKNTHAETHKQYELEIMEIFKIQRKNENRRYKPFKKLHNRKLLWHGSRFTNFVGILSQGLRIAPKEAPATGYMFGKGIYFADMVSKSANYCCTNKNSPIGLMMLCEVALGDMHECTEATYIEPKVNLPKNKHSCKGVGRTQPDPKSAHKREDGVELPIGKAVTDDEITTSLLYNEYIVYDVAQVNCQYLFQMKFNYKF